MTYEEFKKLYDEDAEFKNLIDEKSKAKSKAIDNIAAKQVENIIADINTSDNEFLQTPMQEPKQEIKQAQTPTQEVGQALEQNPQALSENPTNVANKLGVAGGMPIVDERKQEPKVLNNLNSDELYNELSYLNNDFLQKKLAENYKKYGKENQSIQEYEEQFNEYLDKRIGARFSEESINKYFSKTKNKSILDRDYFQVKNIEDENIRNALKTYRKEIHERALQNKSFISADEWLEKRAYKLENLGSEVESTNADIDVFFDRYKDIITSNEKLKEKSLAKWKILSDTYKKRGYTLTMNEDGDIIATDDALGISRNIGDGSSFWKNIWASKGEFIGQVGGAFLGGAAVGAWSGAGAVGFGMANAGRVAFASILGSAIAGGIGSIGDMMNAAKELGLEVSLSDLGNKASDSAMASIMLDSALMGAGKVVKKGWDKAIGKPLNGAINKVASLDGVSHLSEMDKKGLINKAYEHFFKEGINNADSYVKYNLGKDRYKDLDELVVYNNNLESPLVDLSNTAYKDRDISAGLYNNIISFISIQGKDANARGKEYLALARMEPTKRAAGLLIRGVTADTQYAKDLIKIIETSTKEFENKTLSKESIEDKVSNIADLLKNRVSEIQDNFNKAIELINKVDEKAGIKSDLSQVYKILDDFNKKSKVAQSVSDDESRFIRRMIARISDDDKPLELSFNDLDLIRRDLQEFYQVNSKGALGSSYNKIRNIIAETTNKHLESLNSHIKSEISLKDVYKQARKDYSSYLLVSDSAFDNLLKVSQVRKTPEAGIAYEDFINEMAKQLSRSDVLDKNKISNLELMMTRVGFSDEQRAYTESVIFDNVIKKHAYRLGEDLEPTTYAYEKILKELEQYKFASDEIKNRVNVVRSFAKFLRNDELIVDKIKDKIQPKTTTFATELMGKVGQIHTLTLFNVLSKYAVGELGRSSAFQYHLLKAIKNSKDLSTLAKNIKEDAIKLDKSQSNLMITPILKQLAQDIKTSAKLSDEALTKKGKIKSVKAKSKENKAFSEMRASDVLEHFNISDKLAKEYEQLRTPIEFTNRLGISDENYLIQRSYKDDGLNGVNKQSGEVSEDLQRATNTDKGREVADNSLDNERVDSVSRRADDSNGRRTMDDIRNSERELPANNEKPNIQGQDTRIHDNERTKTQTDINRPREPERIRPEPRGSNELNKKQRSSDDLVNKKAKQKKVKDLSDEKVLNESIKEAKEQRTLSEVAKNYSGTIDKANINTNIQSLKLLKELESSGRIANEEEQRLLASFSGFGKDAQKVFSEDSKYLKELKEFLSDDEIESLKRATLDAYFTPTSIVNNMYEIMKKQGLSKGDLILEPSVGLGAFVRGKSEYSFNLVELNPLIARFTKQLYPSSKLINDDYIKTSAKTNFILANPPYGNIKTFYKNEELNIHNAFVKKMIDDLNDGGTLGMVITHSFVDNMDNAMKEFLYKNADFITMLKVPNKAFKDTEVNTDIIFFKKGTGQNIDDMLNNFYEKYPQNLLGASKSQKTNQYGKLEDYFSGGVLDKAHANDDIKINLDDIKIYEYEKNPIINKELDQPLLKAREYYNKNADEVRAGEVYVKDNKVYFNDSEININELDKTRKAAYKKFIELYPQIKSLRTTLNSLREAELSDAKLDTINLLRTKLNHDYDVLAKKLKNDNIFNSHALRYGLENDAYAYELKALIGYDEKTKKYYKNDIFHKRVFNPIKAESKPETIVEAFYYNQNKNYAFYSKSIGELLDNRFSIEEIEKELLDKELVLKNHNGELIDTNELLSGDLLEKIADFKNAKTLDEYQLKTLEKLENALPERIKIDDISFSMSSNIIKEKYIKEFFSDTYKANIKEIIKEPNTSKIDVVFSELGEHKLYVDDLHKTYDISDFADIILNNKQVIAQKYINKELVVSDKGTQALKGIISDIKLKFDKFVRSNYATEIEDSVYKLNAKINKSYENSHISIQGMNADISLYEHQKNAVARVLDNKATFIAHEMGLGKTMSIASSVMKLKEVGKANRSMIITPKAVVGQFANEFKFLYPNSKILMIDKFDVDNRLKTLNMMKYNDFDVCIISHDNFKNIKINAEYEANFIKNEIAELKDTIERIKKRDNENINIKNLQLRMENAEAKLKNRLEIANNEKDNVFFDDLGIDALFVDEAHKFKNMSFYSSFKNLKGLGAEKASDIAYDMYIKTSFLRDNDKHIVFATGTPLSNSITELYSYMRMLKPELLGEYNIHSLDDFVNAFAKVETVLEPNAKNELVEATRITDIVNIKTLKNMLFNVMDYMSNKELKEFWQERAKNGDLIAHDKLRRLAPNIEHIEVAIEPTAEHKARNRLYASFHDDLQNGKDHALAGLEHYKKMYEENRLNEKYEGRFSSDKIYTRKLAANGELNAARMNDSIDIRLNGGTLDDENSKINTAVKNIISTAKEWQKDKGTQIVFLDKSNAMQDEIRQKLIKSGEFKESEIINIRDFDKITNENKRNEEIAKALEKMQNGEVRVLIGSRQKLGAGVNVQKRIVALHNIDAPWNAADYMQALGRAERQGNELNQIYDNFSVKSYNYVLKESFDAKVYDILKHKQNISRTFFAKDSNLNSAENFAGDIPFETMSNLANGNELATKMHELMKQRATLLENKAAIEAANTNNEQMLSKNQALFSKANKTQKLIKSLDIKESENVIIGGKEYPKNSDTNKLIKEHLRTNQHSHDFLLSYDGVYVNYQRKGFNKYELFIYDKIDGVDTRLDLVKEFSLDDNTNILQRLKNSFVKFDDIVKEQGEIKYNALKKINEAKEYKVQVFNDDEKIIKLNNEIAELKQEIERQVKAAKEQAFNEPIKEEIKQEIKPIMNETKNLSDDESLAMLEKHLKEREYFLEFVNDVDKYNAKLTLDKFLDEALADLYFENQKFFGKIANNEELKEKIANDLFNKFRTKENTLEKISLNDLGKAKLDELVNSVPIHDNTIDETHLNAFKTDLITELAKNKNKDFSNIEEVANEAVEYLKSKKLKNQELKPLKNDLINKSEDELMQIAKEQDLSVKELNDMLLKKQIAEYRANLTDEIRILKELNHNEKKEIIRTLIELSKNNVDDEVLEEIVKEKLVGSVINKVDLDSLSFLGGENGLRGLLKGVLYENGKGTYINARLLASLSDDELAKYSYKKELIPFVKITSDKKDEILLKFLEFVKADKLKGAKTKLKNMRSLDGLHWYDDKVEKRVNEFANNYVDISKYKDYHEMSDYLYKIKQNLRELISHNRIDINLFADSKVGDFM